MEKKIKKDLWRGEKERERERNKKDIRKIDR